jgi:serine/threonine protein kinase
VLARSAGSCHDLDSLPEDRPMTSAKWLSTWQNARNGLTDLLARPREEMRPLARSSSDFPELRGAVRIREGFGGSTLGGREGTFDGREYPEVRGWLIVDFRPPLFGRYNFVPFTPDELEVGRSGSPSGSAAADAPRRAPPSTPGGETPAREIAQFRLERKLGQGGMGVVYLAQDLDLGRKVALKLIAPHWLDDRRARARFQREIDHSVAIEHPSIVPVYAAGFDAGQFYIAMRYVPGTDLAQLQDAEGALSEARSLHFVSQIAAALAAVHARRMVHRDVKPKNIMIWNAGEDDEHALLTDFGIAKALDDSGSLTRWGGIGTPDYMAPEVCLGRLAQPASDQYSLACVVYEMLSQRRPYPDTLDPREAHVEATPIPLREVAPASSPAVAAAVARALSKSPGDRYATITAFSRALSGSDTSPPAPAHPRPPVQRQRGPERRHWTDQLFFADLEQRAGAEAVDVARRILEWGTDRDLAIRYGGGGSEGSLMPTREWQGQAYYLATVWTYGKLEIAFEQLRNRPPFDAPDRRRGILSALNQIAGIQIPADAFNRRPSIPLSTLSDDDTLAGVLAVWSEFLRQIG